VKQSLIFRTEIYALIEGGSYQTAIGKLKEYYQYKELDQWGYAASALIYIAQGKHEVARRFVSAAQTVRNVDVEGKLLLDLQLLDLGSGEHLTESSIYESYLDRFNVHSDRHGDLLVSILGMCSDNWNTSQGFSTYLVYRAAKSGKLGEFISAVVSAFEMNPLSEYKNQIKLALFVCRETGVEVDLDGYTQTVFEADDEVLTILYFDNLRPRRKGQKLFDLYDRKVNESKSLSVSMHRTMAEQLYLSGLYEQSYAAYKRIDPNKVKPDDTYNIALTLDKLGHSGRSLEILKSCDQSSIHTQEAIFSILVRMGRYQEAEMIGLAISKNAQQTNSYAYNLSLLQLRQGKLLDGFRNYENRFPELKILPTDGFELDPQMRLKPHVRGGDEAIVFGEQGIGDQIFFLRYVVELAKNIKTVQYVIDRKLLDILTPYRKHFPFKLLSRDQVKDSSASRQWVEAGSLPFILGLDQIPQEVRLPFQRTVDFDDSYAFSIGSANVDMEMHKKIDFTQLVKIANTLKLRGLRPRYCADHGLTEKRREEYKTMGIDSALEEDPLDKVLLSISSCQTFISVSNTNIHLCGLFGIEATLILPRPEAVLWYWAEPNTGGNLPYRSIKILRLYE
jgi:hypothetical protein